MNCSVVTDWAPSVWESEGELGCADDGWNLPRAIAAQGSPCVGSNLAASTPHSASYELEKVPFFLGGMGWDFASAQSGTQGSWPTEASVLGGVLQMKAILVSCFEPSAHWGQWLSQSFPKPRPSEGFTDPSTRLGSFSSEPASSYSTAPGCGATAAQLHRGRGPSLARLWRP